MFRVYDSTATAKCGRGFGPHMLLALRLAMPTARWPLHAQDRDHQPALYACLSSCVLHSLGPALLHLLTGVTGPKGPGCQDRGNLQKSNSLLWRICTSVI